MGTSPFSPVASVCSSRRRRLLTFPEGGTGEDCFCAAEDERVVGILYESWELKSWNREKESRQGKRFDGINQQSRKQTDENVRGTALIFFLL